MLGLAIELAGNVAELSGMVDVVIQHILEYGYSLFTAVRMGVLPLVGMLVAVGVGVAVLVRMGMLMDMIVGMLVVKMVHIDRLPVLWSLFYIDTFLTRYTIPQIPAMCKA